MIKLRQRVVWQVLCGALALLPAAALAQSISVTVDRADGVYGVGDHVTFTTKLTGEVRDIVYTLLPDQDEKRAVKQVVDDMAVVTFEAIKPGSVLLKVTGKSSDGEEIVGIGGAIVAPNDIKPSAEVPADFAAFWQAQLAKLRAIPMDAKLEPVALDRNDVDYAKVSLANINASHVTGQIARPRAGQKFPALLVVQWAGVYGLDRSWVVDRAAQGWLALNILPHDLPIDSPEAFYKAQKEGPLENYSAIGNADRETSYFLRMYLSCVRAVDYLKTRDDWDGKTIVVFGGSQGGMQALMTAALCPQDITAALANVPAGCDMLGPDVGRRPGWPSWYSWTRGLHWDQPENAAKVHEASRYYDVVNFAPMIRCPTLLAAGLLDETCPPHGIAAAANQIGVPHTLLLMPGAAHIGVGDSQALFDQRANGVWLPALLKRESPLKP